VTAEGNRLRLLVALGLRCLRGTDTSTLLSGQSLSTTALLEAVFKASDQLDGGR